ncbi:unnamed protein product [Ceutorhynchus assimilis]|uniref:Uncharacterized protein n=1 Tax=Ceutorhynchus assimilis TaxID=467358 RepID=A0A9N9MBC4_9CUCU|nr:unnamed protein product [Ceutorhynchus assimilis]
MKEAEEKRQSKDKKQKKPDNFNFIGGKRNTTSFRYVCAIEAIEGSDEVQVVGLKSMNDLKQDFSRIEYDKSFVKIDQIAGLLPVPMIKNKGTRIFYHFDKKIPVFEV